MPNYIDTIDFGDGVERQIIGQGDISSISVNGVSQTISSGAVNLNVEDNLITESKWLEIQAILA